MTYKGPPQHAQQFMDAMLFAGRRLGLAFVGRYFEYKQRTCDGKAGRWYYHNHKTLGRVSWLTSYKGKVGTITQIVGPKGEWNPSFLQSARHECGHLVLHSHGIAADKHHAILKKHGLDYVRTQ